MSCVHHTVERPRTPFASKARHVVGLVLVLGLVLALIAGRIGPASAADRFVEGIDDLPLMDGLNMVPAANLAFDTGAGRIVVAFADEVRAGAVGFDRVVDFYAATLPQLGWDFFGRTGAVARWTREGEELVVEAVAGGNELVVRFSLSPR